MNPRLFLLTFVLPATLAHAQNAAPGPVSAAAALAAVAPTPEGYRVVDLGPNYRRWERAVPVANSGGTLYLTNGYVELQDGMYYARQGASGPEWAESQALIEGFPGGAVARYGQIQMIFANNLATAGSVDAQTPAGRLRSQILGLTYADTALETNIWIAQVTDCQGVLAGPNQALYPAALVGDGLSASVRYTYRLNGWEQDVLISDPTTLPAPEHYQLDSSSPTLTLQIITEFLDPPPPAVTSGAINTTGGAALEDDEVDWGTLRLGAGKAFFLGQAPHITAIPVTRRWIETERRHLLVEEVQFASLEQALLQSQDQGASLHTTQSTLLAGAHRSPSTAAPAHRSPPHRVSFPRTLPVLRTRQGDSRPMQVATTKPPEARLLIDYTTITTTQSNYVFASDTTYYLSGTNAVSFNGTTTMEGDTVIKVINSPSAGLSIYGPLVLKAGQYRPVIITTKDCNTLGDTITGSSGNPTNYNGGTYIKDNTGTNTYQQIRFLYAGTALSAGNFTNGVWHCQFVNCGTGVSASGGGTIALHNVLFAQCTNCVSTSGTVSGEQITADQASAFCALSYSGADLTNCILTAVASTNGVNPVTSLVVSNGAGIYQTVGSANYYLAPGSTNQAAGSTNISPALLASLANRTTYAPIILTSAVTSATTLLPEVPREGSPPDLGYGYDPLDYCVSGVVVTNTTLLLTNGVAIAFYGTNGFKLQNAANLTGFGLPLTLNRLVSYQTVQEQPAAWGATASFMSLINIPNALTVQPQAHFHFTDFSFPAEPVNQRTMVDNNSGANLLSALDFRDTQWRNGYFYMLFQGTPLGLFTLTNNLLERCYMQLAIAVSGDCGGAACSVRNNLFWNGTFNIYYDNTNANWEVFDNLFDTVSTYYEVLTNGCGGGGGGGGKGPLFPGGGTTNFTAGYNGYKSTTAIPQDCCPKILTVTDYQTGPLGLYYYPTNGLSGGLTNLIDTGSTWATSVGLYQYTTTTNEVKEGSTKLDRGFHWVALGTNGLPASASGDLLGDWFKDSNGNGVYDSADIGNWLTNDTCGDGISDAIKFLQGRNLRVKTTNDTSNLIQLNVYTPLK